jgi:hypothetical protein
MLLIDFPLPVTTAQSVVSYETPVSASSRSCVGAAIAAASRDVGDETEYLLSSPANARQLRESIEELRRGRGIARELLDPHG